VGRYESIGEIVTRVVKNALILALGIWIGYTWRIQDFISPAFWVPLVAVSAGLIGKYLAEKYYGP